jgi:hypothetical protein
MSSRVRSGKSVRMSSSLIPEARYSNTSETVMRRTRTQSLPPRFFGFKSYAVLPIHRMKGSLGNHKDQGGTRKPIAPLSTMHDQDPTPTLRHCPNFFRFFFNRENFISCDLQKKMDLAAIAYQGQPILSQDGLNRSSGI